VFQAFYERPTAALSSIPGFRHEIIFVNDGSRDDSQEQLAQLAATDTRVKVIKFSRNFGHQIAISAGIDHAHGDCVAVIDADLQDPPEVIADMTAKWREGYDVVYGVRASRQGESRLKLFTAAPYYRLLSRIVKIDIPVDVGDFRLMSRRTADGEPRLRHNRHRVFWCCSGGSAIASGDREGSNEQPLRLTSAVLMSANGCYAGVPRQPHGVIGGKFAVHIEEPISVWPKSPLGAFLVAAVLAVALAGCGAQINRHGHVFMDIDLAQIQPGMQKEQVATMLGSPDTTSTINGDAPRSGAWIETGGIVCCAAAPGEAISNAWTETASLLLPLPLLFTWQPYAG
jgi:Glycosyl transferase family 2/SmpA / OmlA family